MKVKASRNGDIGVNIPSSLCRLISSTTVKRTCSSPSSVTVQPHSGESMHRLYNVCRGVAVREGAREGTTFTA